MEFQRGMWAEAWIQSINARKLIALVVIGELANQISVEWFGIDPSIKLVTSTLLWSCLVYIVYVQILSPSDRRAGNTVGRMLGLTVRVIGIFALIATIAICTFLFAEFAGVDSRHFLFAMAVIVVLPPFIWLATILPAYVAGRAYGLRDAIERGKAQFIWIAERMLVGPVLLTYLPAILYLRVASHLRSSRKLDYNGHLWDKEWVFQPAELLLMIWYYLVMAAVVVLTTVILARAFIRSEGKSGDIAA